MHQKIHKKNTLLFFQKTGGFLKNTSKTRLKTFEGTTKEVVKLAIFAEKGRDGEVFYKIEGQTATTQVMIQYDYDKEKAIEKLLKLTEELLTEQTKELEKNVN